VGFIRFIIIIIIIRSQSGLFTIQATVHLRGLHLRILELQGFLV